MANVGAQVGDIKPWAAEDVRKAEYYEADDVLEYLLRRASPKIKFLDIRPKQRAPDVDDPTTDPSGRAKPEESEPLCRSSRVKDKGGKQEESRSSLKRPSQVDSESRASKRNKTEDPGGHEAVQTALYSAEMFSANIAVSHAINFIVREDVIWVSYYDHQSVIHVGGFNFVQDLPRFLVLLCALQRFKLDDWGRNTVLEPHPKNDRIDHHTVKVDGYKLTLESKDRISRFCLKGRGTDLSKVTCEQLEKQMPNETKGGMVAKIYWVEEARVSENDLERVKKVAAVGSRRFRVLMFAQLEPMKRLQGGELLQAWRECVLCHYELWKAGVHHRDVSCENLMKDNLSGVLIDFDLASLATSVGNGRTGTIPFMAINLLEGGQDGKVKHLYRHDMESFIWAFIWKRAFLSMAEVPHGISDEDHVADLMVFLERQVTSRDARRLQLANARRRLSDNPAPFGVGQLREKIERLQAELVEKSDDDMFTNFAMEIGFDKKRIEDKVADVVARYSKETQEIQKTSAKQSSTKQIHWKTMSY
ncbi:hypothetical protein PAXINDRAFT_20885 [Paxillus involutus ATCC 200175]|uniref:Fungal-type protein kinase domain-containing protein n=1 Tax=Paxillus involutus ATCC 200175 TaxID=664439 RepID=A0A0C9SU37_PAXIN|nr:hypothetical protein PAXINDRAFT_20885 [Paxillus involutus ATCC 200175]